MCKVTRCAKIVLPASFIKCTFQLTVYPFSKIWLSLACEQVLKGWETAFIICNSYGF